MSDLVPEEAIEAGAMALTEVTKRPWADTLPGARDVLRRNARLSVTAAAPLILAAYLDGLAAEYWSSSHLHRVCKARAAALRSRGEGDRDG